MQLWSVLSVLHILSLLGGATSASWPGTRKDVQSAAAAAAKPVLETRPFVVVWNMPTAHCQERYGVHLDLKDFDILENRHNKFLGQNMTIFYQKKLGLYPYLSKKGERVNGGLPQCGYLRAHLAKARAEIKDLLRPGFHGLAVIDWEKWRPLWVRNFGSKRKYQNLSEQLIEKEYPGLSKKEVVSLACKEFESGARRFMSSTLRLGARLRPAGLWGFYRFPDCYNYHKGPPRNNYTGHCLPKTSEKNNRLDWLWRRSSALYPSIYLPKPLAGSKDAGLMVRYRVLEALRVASAYPSGPKATPVLPYARVAFAHTLQYLNKTDLEHTLGEAAGLGAAGVVLWGELRFAKSKRRCEKLRDYVSSVLGIYVRTLKSGVQHCSQHLCNDNGRCARRDPHSSHMMHCSGPDPPSIPDAWNITCDHTDLISAFRCLCYQGWTGERCQERMP